MQRVVIYPKEMAFILGKSESHCRELVRTMRVIYKKRRHQSITIKEFCDYMDFPYEDIFQMINPTCKSTVSQ
jgi:hypothetical protein